MNRVLESESRPPISEANVTVQNTHFDYLRDAVRQCSHLALRWPLGLTLQKPAGKLRHVRQNTHTQGAIVARRATQSLVTTHHVNDDTCRVCGKVPGTIWTWTGKTYHVPTRLEGVYEPTPLASHELAATCRACFVSRPAYVQQKASLEAALALPEVSA